MSELTEKTRMEQSNISHALKKMHECNIVNMKKSGKQRIYSLNKDTIVPILKVVDMHAKKSCPQCAKI